MTPGKMRQRKQKRLSSTSLSTGVLFIMLALGLYGAFLLIRPFMGPIVIAIFLGVIFRPMYNRIVRLLRGRQTVAAALSVVVVFLVVVIPFFLFLAALARQGISVFNAVQNWIAAGNMESLLEGGRLQGLLEHPRLAPVRDLLGVETAEGGGFDLEGRIIDLSRQAVQSLGGILLPLISKTGTLVMHFFIMLFIMFYAFRDGDTMLGYFLDILPLSHSHENLLVERVRFIVRAVLVGMVLTAAIQALVAMIGFKIVGIPALFWGVVLGVSSFIPLVGIALVWVPVAAYLAASGKLWAALFILVWCGLGVGTIDNFLRPYLMQGRSGMSTLILFFALLGGIQLFGPIGLLYGPMILGLLAVMLYIYRLQHSRALAQLDRQ
jgi:predicted PurR-regulated permease PerM